MSYLVLARKYRPQTFDELVGQEFVSATISNAIRLNRLHHAYLFSGVRGVGKTSAARILAKTLNCLSPVNGNACNTCENCAEITNGSSVDVLEIDGASNNGVDEIRKLREMVQFNPIKCKYKVYIIDEMHMLTKEASAALLKTLEEPPPHVIFIFATTDAHKVIPTILSRCQRYDFKRIPYGDMRKYLEGVFQKENISCSEDALNLIIRYSEGCMRDALSLSDQVISYASGNITHSTVAQTLGLEDDPVIWDIFAAVLKEDSAALDELINRLYNSGVSLLYAVEKLITHARNLLLLSKKAENLRKELTHDEIELYDTLLENATEHRLYALFQLMQKMYGDMKYASFARYNFEFGLYKAASLSRIIPLPVPELQKQRVPVSPQAAAPSADEQKNKTLKAQPSGLSQLERQWYNLLGELRNERPDLASVLEHSALSESNAEKVVISFHKGSAVLNGIAADGKNHAALQDFLRKKLGSSISLEIRGGAEEKQSLNDKKNELKSRFVKESKHRTAETPVMKRLLDLFEANADDLKVNEKERAYEYAADNASGAKDAEADGGDTSKSRR